MPSVDDFLSTLRKIVPSSQILTGTGVSPYLSDSLRPSRAYQGFDNLHPHAACVFMPKSAEEVARVVRLAFQEGVPVVPYGAGTGLMGGAVPVKGGVVIDTRRMNKVLEVSREEMWAKAEAGIVLGDLNAAMNRTGLVLGHDPWTLSIATLGGAISTNGLGYQGYRYGSMGQQVLGLEVVLPSGQVLSTRPVAQSSTGLSLKQLFIGTEGVFGVITQATVRAFPAPQHRKLFGYRFASFEAGFQAVQEIFGLGLKPSLLDFGEEYPHLTSEKLPEECASLLEVVLYLGFEGFPEEVEVMSRLAESVCQKAAEAEAPESEVDSFWRGRHWSGDRSGWVQQPDILTDYLHVSLPPSKVLPYRKQAIDIIRQADMHLRECGLWNQSGLFSIVVQAPAARGQKLSQCVDSLLLLTHDMGGSMEYCHGVGLRLSHLMEQELGGPGMELLRSIKRAVDPENIMNPGKMGL